MLTSELLKSKSECCGCRACQNVCSKNAISFKVDENGFLYPNIDETKCINCKQCIGVCHFVDKEYPQLNDPIKCYAAINKDKNILAQSTSGGVFSALADIVLSKNGVVFGAMMDEQFNIKHIYIENSDDLNKLRKSKYAQSDIGLSYREAKYFLDQSRFVLFSGTPCQIGGLYSYLGNKEYDNLFTVDIVCHGTPSNLMFKKFIAYLEKKHNEKISNFNFRTKDRTWLRFEESYDSKDNKHYNVRIGKFEEFYHTCFVGGHISQEGCFSCKYATSKRVADFTMGDFWGFDKANLSLDERKGLSFVTFNTNKSLSIFEEINQRMDLESVDYSIVVQGNKCLRNPTKKGKFWDYYMKAYREDTIDVAAKQYIDNRKQFIRKQNFLFSIPYPLYKEYRFHLLRKRITDLFK